MPFKIVRNDLSKMTTDVIVNPANEGLKMGGGVCGAIFKAAGIDALSRECDAIGHCDVGDVVITGGCKLPCKAIIHTVGPVWKGGKVGEAELLASCYQKSLEAAYGQGHTSIAFPLISSGTFGYPKAKALAIAVETIRHFLEVDELMVYMVVYDKESYTISHNHYKNIQRFIDDHYVDQHSSGRRYLLREEISSSMAYSNMEAPKLAASKKKRSLEDVVANLDETFAERLFRLIDEKDMTDVEVYKRANIDRKLFSKIRSKPNYKPSKMTAISLALAVELNFDETQDLLEKLGYTLSRSSRFDVIIEFFIDEGTYDIFKINEALFAFDEPVLG